ncbi:class I SAM-dependent methyltransferase [Kitasatospora sp. NPDC059327]|uniref:class I SAM-dependent methyltransferase n=1 Tax=Kitasatospora sp. NPDC059327 TaxID=3346803 RepID=UPI0036759436
MRRVFKGQSGAAGRMVRYYRRSPRYLSGEWGGTCHFGYTPPGWKFNLESALVAMEQQLAQTLALPPNSLVLDAGCGYGRVASTLAGDPFRLNVIGVDLIPERLVEARRYIEDRGLLRRVQLLNTTYCSLPIGDNTLSAVFTMEALVHADPLEAALGQFWRVLKPGGRLVLFEYSVPPRDSAGPWHQRIADSIALRTGMASIERFTHDGFPALLKAANFENVKVRDISRNVWPTWRWMFWLAIRKYWPGILCGGFIWRPNLAGALLIWPNRRHLGYKIVTATKPS